MKNIEDLRNHLFETIDALRDKAKPMEIERAKAIAGVAQVIVNSVRAENEFLELTGSKGSGFIPKQLASGGAAAVSPAVATPEQSRLLKSEKSDRLGLIDRCHDQAARIAEIPRSIQGDTCERDRWRIQRPRGTPDPNCGGVIAPRTNGNGGLRDACDKCGRTVTKTRSA